MFSFLSKSKSKYWDVIIFYVIPCATFAPLCVVDLGICGYYAWKMCNLSIGLLILIILGFILALLSIIAMVAGYREISRIHNMQLKVDIEDKLEEHNKRLDNIEKEILDLKSCVSNLEKTIELIKK